MNFYADLGARLRALRKSRRLRQCDMARQLGVTTRTVQRIEYGQQRPGGDIVASWCRIAGASLTVTIV